MTRSYKVDELEREVPNADPSEHNRLAFTVPNAGIFVSGLEKAGSFHELARYQEEDRGSGRLSEQSPVQAFYTALDNIRKYVSPDDWKRLLRSSRDFIDTLEEITENIES